MRVLFLTPVAGLGGAERALLEMIAALGASEPPLTMGVLALEEGPLLDRCRALGVETTVVASSAGFASTGESGAAAAVTVLGLVRSAVPLARAVAQLRGHVRRWRPDLVHSNGIKTHVLGAWLGASPAPLVWHVHDYLSARSLSPAILRAHRTCVSLVLANSTSVARDVGRVLGETVPVVTAYNAIDTDRFTPDGSRLNLDRAAGLEPAAPTAVRVGLVGTYARWKGHDVFLRALAALPDRHRVRAYVIGGPVYRTAGSQWSRPELRALVATLGLEDCVGFVDWLDDPSPAYRSLDVVVHASTRPEPFGLAIAEAMACGRPVVMAAAGGTLEIGVPERTCLAHPPGDVAGLSAALSRLVADVDLRHALGDAARASVRQRFTRDRLVDSLRSAYASIGPTVPRAA